MLNRSRVSDNNKNRQWTGMASQQAVKLMSPTALSSINNGPSFVCVLLSFLHSQHRGSRRTPSDRQLILKMKKQRSSRDNKLKDLWHTFLVGLWIPLTRDAYHVTRPLLLSMSTLGSLRPIRVGSQTIYIDAVKRWFHLEWGALDGGSGWSREWWAWITRWGLVISFVFKWRSNAPN